MPNADSTHDASVTSIRDAPVNHCDPPVNHSEKRERHARTPDSVLKSTTVSLQARAVYAGLARHAFKGGKVYIGQRRLAEILGTTQPTISRCIDELLAAKLIEKEEDTPGRRANYKLLSNIFLPLERSTFKKRPSRLSETAKAALQSNSRATLDEILGA